MYGIGTTNPLKVITPTRATTRLEMAPIYDVTSWLAELVAAEGWLVGAGGGLYAAREGGSAVVKRATGFGAMASVAGNQV